MSNFENSVTFWVLEVTRHVDTHVGSEVAFCSAVRYNVGIA